MSEQAAEREELSREELAESGAEWVSTGGIALLAGVSSSRIRQLYRAGALPEPESLMQDGSRLLPLWSMATAAAWVESR